MIVAIYPLLVLKFWYIDAFVMLLGVARQIFDFTLSLFSLPLLMRTFFRPIKNEYHKNLIVFSIIFGIAIKTLLIAVSLVFVCAVLVIEILLLFAFLLFPIGVIAMPFIHL